MSVQFQCPSCARTLFYDSGEESFQTCYHCGGQIIVPSTVIHQQEALDVKPTQREFEEQKNFRIAEIQSVLNAGNKIQAIQLFMDSFGTGLAESKQAIEMLETGRRIPTQVLDRMEPVQALGQTEIKGPVQDPEDNSVARGLLIMAATVAIGIALLIVFIIDS